MTLLGALLSLGAGAAPQQFTPDDLAAIVRVGDPQLSPDGRSIVFVIARSNIRDAHYDSSLVVIDVATGTQRVLTYDRHGVNTPRWSPSGDRIAFLDRAAGAPSLQVFVMPMGGGDARPVTCAPNNVEYFSWSPDGAMIAYVTADENPRQIDIDRHDDAFEVSNNGYLATSTQMPSHLWLVAAEGGAAHRLTSGTWSVASPPSWSPDGRSIAIVQQVTPNAGDEDQSVIATLDLATDQIRKLTHHAAYEDQPVYSPDGSAISFLYPRDGVWGDENGVFITSSAGGDGIDAARTLDRQIHHAIWSPDSRTLLACGHSGTKTLLWRLPREGGRTSAIDLGDLEPTSSNISVAQDGGIALIAASPSWPDELYYLPVTGGQPRRLTDFNRQIASRDLGRAESFSWQGPNGFSEDGVVVYPSGFKSDHRYPLVLVIHGGPDGASTLQFDAPAQLLAARGYVVFMPNYRGSDNRGNGYQRAIFQDAGDGPGRDLMAGIAALERLGYIDRNRVAVSGWSYGGYMTAWLTGHYHIWKAAVSGAAVTDFVHSYNLSDLNRTLGYNFGGSPWTGARLKKYLEQSPISYVRQIRTPTLILADTFDSRVPITQSYLLYHALKDNGVPVQFFAYPVHEHFPDDPVRARDVYRRWIDWLDRYIPRTS